MTDHFKDQVVVITGGGRGIGRATALEFACEGATVLLAGRRMDALETAANECRHSGGQAEIVHCDVAKDDDLRALIGRAIAHHGKIDVLVNNAGVISGGRLDEIPGEDIGRMVGVNIWAPIRLAQLALPHMREAKRGTIVNVSSVAGRMGLPYYATYCASKYAMRGFSEALRREVARDGVHVVAVYPGPTATDLMENVEVDGLGLSVATAQQVAQALVRGVRWHQPEVFIGIGESIVSRWNDLLPWTVDYTVDFMRERMHAAVHKQRTT
ncbi:MAG: SDR family oxidoreductase [Chloroflexi bacterium]|nr:SDR family oxidoreductase [Chloroflexota bacterium]